MENKKDRFKNFIIRNKWFFVGFLLVTLFVFSNYFYGYKLSFSNVNYAFAPFNSYGFRTDGPLLSDIADNHYPAIHRLFYGDEGFSLWESDIALGRTSNALSELMNPMKWVYFLPFEIAIFLKCFSEFAIAFFSMFLFMKAIGLKKYSAALSGAIYAFSSVIVVWLGWSHSDVAAWAPMLFFAIEKMISTIKLKYMFLSAFVIYVMLIVGMPTYAAYFLYLAGVYIVIFTFIRHWKNKRNIFIIGGMFAVSAILAALVSFPYTYTLLGNVVSNGYAGSRGALAELKLGFEYLRTFVFPHIRDGFTKHANESTLYAGIISVIVLPFALCNNKNKKRNIFFLIASIVVFALIFTDIFNFIYTKLPMINTSSKYRVITLLMFTLSAMTGITLNDIFVNKEYYLKKKWLFAIVAAWTFAVVFIASRNLSLSEHPEIIDVIKIIIPVFLCIIILAKKNYKIIYGLLAVLIIMDSAQFTKDYLPWIDAQAQIVPEATDSVSYLMDNAKQEERIAGLGKWTFFPNTPSYYDLNDVRTHGFEATNADMREYYTKIDRSAYTSRTRTELNNIENYELLKYLGVRYIYGTNLGSSVEIGSEETDAPRTNLGVIPSDSTVAQDIYLQQNPEYIRILFATYASTPQSMGDVTVSVVSKDGGQSILEESIPVNTIKDGMYLTVAFDDNVSEGMYTLTLSFGDLGTDTLTAWMKESEDTVTFNEAVVDGSLIMNVVYGSEEYDISYVGTDSLLIGEFSQYSDKVELAENAYTYSSKEDVLNAMMEGYIDNTAFLEDGENVEAYSIPLTENESIEMVEYSDDYVKVLCTSEYDRYVMLNDYYNKDWSAYVNGQEVHMEKANYLMRAVKVSAGEDMVIEFKYEPDKLYIVTACAATTFVLALAAFIFRKKLQNQLDKLIR